jgi:hypothetical protein
MGLQGIHRQAGTNKVNISSAVQTRFKIVAAIAFISGAKGTFSSPPPAAVADPRKREGDRGRSGFGAIVAAVPPACPGATRS